MRFLATFFFSFSGSMVILRNRHTFLRRQRRVFMLQSVQKTLTHRDLGNIKCSTSNGTNSLFYAHVSVWAHIISRRRIGEERRTYLGFLRHWEISLKVSTGNRNKQTKKTYFNIGSLASDASYSSSLCEWWALLKPRGFSHRAFVEIQRHPQPRLVIYTAVNHAAPRNRPTSDYVRTLSNVKPDVVCVDLWLACSRA